MTTFAPETADPRRDAERAPAALEPLATGTRLGEFEVLQVLGFGGFGVVYLALDHALLRQVAIKEYLPAALARREADAQVSPRCAADAQTYATGLQSFVNEARLLARFDHPSLVKVLRYWEAQGTAYMAMPYYPGRTLKDERRAMAQAPGADWLVRIVEPLLGALEALHRDGVYHRDVSPDNIVLLPTGVPVLLDFGAARRVVGDRTQTLTAVLKPSFAPVEQYLDLAHAADMRQGPWTDLYALGAVLRFMLTGAAPVPAAVRAVRDVMPPLARDVTLCPGYSPQFLAAVDWAMALAPQDRPQSVVALRQAFAAGPQDAAPTNAVPPAPAPAAQPQPAVTASWRAPWRQRPRLFAAVALSAVAGLAWTLGISRDGADAGARAHEAPATAAPAPAPAPSTEDAPPAVPVAVAAPAATPVAAALTPVGPPRAVALRQSRAAPPVVKTPSDQDAAALVARASATRAVPAIAQGQAEPELAPPDPREACSDYNFVSRWVCLARQCQSPRFSGHAACVQLQAQEAARRQAQLER